MSLIRSPETGRLALPRLWTVNGTSVLRHAPRSVTSAVLAFGSVLDLGADLKMSYSIK